MFPAYFEEMKLCILGKLKNRVREPYCHYLALYLTVLIDFLLGLVDFAKTLLLIFSAVAVFLVANNAYLYFVAGVLILFSAIDVIRGHIKFCREWKDYQRQKASMRNVGA